MVDTSQVTVNKFREVFPVFENPEIYPNLSVQTYLDLAFANLPAARWGTAFELGQCLYTAHFLTMDQREIETAERGGTVGSSTSGMVSSKSLGAASISYDVSSIAEKDGGHWNTTAYGRRFLRMMRMAGMGGIQISPLPASFAGGSFPRRW